MDLYQTTPADLHETMEDLGYVGRLIAEDHEQHYVFTHPEGRQL